MEEDNKTKELKKWTQEELDAVLQKHIENNCESKLDLSSSDLSDCDISYRQLLNVDFSMSNLSNVSITHCLLDNCIFNDCKLDSVLITYSSIYYCEFKDTIICDSTFRYTTIHCSVLDNTEFTICRFMYSNIEFIDGPNIPPMFRANSIYHSNIHPLHMANTDSTSFNTTISCPSHGKFIGWKKCIQRTNEKSFCLVKLEIPASAIRTSAIGDKCRTNKAKVLGIWDICTNEKLTEAVSIYDRSFVYRVGETITVDDFDENRWHECAPGIHFYVDKEAALRY